MHFLSVVPRAALAILLGGAPAVGAADSPAGDWASPIGRDHPLAGRIWLPDRHRFIDPPDAVAMLRGARFVLLGEKHDNIDHHRLQAWLVREIAARRQPAIALEAITTRQIPALQAFLARQPGSANGIGAALDWDRTGWPAWRHYAPIVQPVLEQGGPVLAATPPRALLRAVATRGVAALPADRIRALGLDADLPPAARAVLEREIVEGHCGQLPAAMTGPMVDVQRVKDAIMAEALIAGAAAPGRDLAVLIAGTGHARRDHGVPWHLARLAPKAALGAATVALGFVEVRSGRSDPASYAANFGAAHLPFDIVWFTPRVDNADPCAVHEEELRRSRERRSAPAPER